MQKTGNNQNDDHQSYCLYILKVKEEPRTFAFFNEEFEIGVDIFYLCRREESWRLVQRRYDPSKVQIVAKNHVARDQDEHNCKVCLEIHTLLTP